MSAEELFAILSSLSVARALFLGPIPNIVSAQILKY